MNKSAAWESELGVISSVLEEPEILPELLEYLSEDNFSYVPYKNAWEAMSHLHEQNMGIDVITLGDELHRRENLQDFSINGYQLYGRPALSKAREFGEPRNALTYAANVLDYYAKDLILGVSQKAAYWSQNGRKADDILKDTIESLTKIRTINGKAATHTQSMKEALSDAKEKTQEAIDGKIVAVPTGIKDIDRALGGGMYAPDLIIVAGRPGTGKTSFMTTVSRNAAKYGKRVLFCTLEMANAQIAMRLITMESGIPFSKQRSGKFGDNEYPIYENGCKLVEKYAGNILINDVPAMTVSNLRQELRRAGRIDLACFDYLQLAGVDEKKQSRVLEITEISGGLKAACKEFGIPIMAGAQLNRAVETRGKNSKPLMSDLREGGSIENDADVIVFLHKEEKEESTNHSAIIGKHRNGGVGEIPLKFLEKKMLFADLAHTYGD